MNCLRKHAISFIRIRAYNVNHGHKQILWFPYRKRENDLGDKCLSLKSYSLRSIYTCEKKYGRDFYLDKEVELRLTEEAKHFPYAVHELEFTTCEELNQFFYQTKQDINRSLKGIRFNVAYVDTHPDADRKTPVILALHGTPGNHLDFKEIIQFLAQRNVRVIVPNFPGFGWTPTDDKKEFRHSFLEKTFFVKDFLQALRIPRVDMIVCHSAGVFPSILLISKFNLSKSLMLINPAGLCVPKSIRPISSYAKLHVSLYRNILFRPLLLAALKVILVISGFGNTNAHQMTVAIESLLNVNHDACRNCTQELASINFPVSIVYSESDQVVEKERFEEYVHLFGGDLHDAYRYDSEGNLISSAKNPQLCETHIFDGGGHFVMKKYPERVNRISYDFLQKIKHLN